MPVPQLNEPSRYNLHKKYGLSKPRQKPSQKVFRGRLGKPGVGECVATTNRFVSNFFWTFVGWTFLSSNRTADINQWLVDGFAHVQKFVTSSYLDLYFLLVVELLVIFDFNICSSFLVHFTTFNSTFVLLLLQCKLQGIFSRLTNDAWAIISAVHLLGLIKLYFVGDIVTTLLLIYGPENEAYIYNFLAQMGVSSETSLRTFAQILLKRIIIFQQIPEQFHESIVEIGCNNHDAFNKKPLGRALALKSEKIGKLHEQLNKEQAKNDDLNNQLLAEKAQHEKELKKQRETFREQLAYGKHKYEILQIS